MAIFGSKVKKTLRLSKYLIFILVGVVFGFANSQKGDSKAIFSGLSIGPAVAHADVPTVAVAADVYPSGSDTPDSGIGEGASSDSGAGSCGAGSSSSE